MVLHPTPDEFRRRLPSLTFQDVGRRGKYLIFRLTNGEALVLHLRMTGSLLLREGNDASTDPDRYTTAVFGLDNGLELIFCDRRKLGTVSLINDEIEIVHKLGPEPLDPHFTVAVLRNRLGNRNAPIKAVLCDQKFIAGIGNMYADEALFAAGIHLLRPANSLSGDETQSLHGAIQQVLRKGIANNGATFSDYRRPGGEKGRQQDAFDVAHRGGQTCNVCSTPIERIPVRNRGTYYCPKCQDSATSLEG
jgi:formamidopyrimidine-DNA glycosylase